MLRINVFAKFASLKTRAIYFVDCSSDPQCCCRCFIYAIFSISPLNLLLITAVKYFIALTHGSQNIYVMLRIKNMQNLHLKKRAINFADCSSDPQCRCRFFIYAILSISSLTFLLITAVKCFIALTCGGLNINVMLRIIFFAKFASLKQEEFTLPTDDLILCVAVDVSSVTFCQLAHSLYC
jgi:hypothetical protein